MKPHHAVALALDRLESPLLTIACLICGLIAGGFLGFIAGTLPLALLGWLYGFGGQDFLGVLVWLLVGIGGIVIGGILSVVGFSGARFLLNFQQPEVTISR